MAHARQRSNGVVKATIEKRRAADGAITYQVKVRLKGCPTQTEIFTRLTDAKRWATQMEGAILDGRHFPADEVKRHTVGEAIDRYRAEVLPLKLLRDFAMQGKVT